MTISESDIKLGIIRPVEDEELMKVAMCHMFKDHALGLLLQADAHQADNVWVPQVRHQLRLADEVLSRLLIRTRLESLDGNQTGDCTDRAVAGQLPLVHLDSESVKVKV